MKIHDLIKQGNLDAVNDQIKLNPNCVLDLNSTKQTPLHIAALKGDSKLIELLIDTANSAEYINQYDKLYNNAVFYTLRHGYFDCLDVLIAKNADLNNVNHENHTVLNRLFVLLSMPQFNNMIDGYRCVEYLLRSGLNPFHKDNGLDSYLHDVNRFKLPEKYWSLLFSYGIGIGFDFSSIKIKVQDGNRTTFLQKITKNKLILGDFMGNRITRDTPGFMDAITDAEQLITALKNGVHIECKCILNAITKFFDQSKDEDVRLKKVTEVLVEYAFPSLKKILAVNIKLFQEHKVLTPQQIAQISKMPNDLQDYLRVISEQKISRKFH